MLRRPRRQRLAGRSLWAGCLPRARVGRHAYALTRENAPWSSGHSDPGGILPGLREGSHPDL